MTRNFYTGPNERCSSGKLGSKQVFLKYCAVFAHEGVVSGLPLRPSVDSTSITFLHVLEGIDPLDSTCDTITLAWPKTRCSQVTSLTFFHLASRTAYGWVSLVVYL